MEDNLSSTSAESFEIERSYRNLNELSNGRYIKDKKFQRKIIKFIKEYDEKKEKIKKIKTPLTENFNLQKLFNKEEDYQYKNTENNIKVVKTKMSDIFFKKKRKRHLQNQLEKLNLNKSANEKETFISVSQTHNPNKKRIKNQLLFNRNEDKNNSALGLNSFSINPDETLGKLDCSNNEMLQFDNNELKSENTIFQLNSRNDIDILKNK